MHCLKALLLAVAVGGLAAGPARADVKPHPLFTDNMVLQQGVEFTVWGTADPGEKVTVELRHTTKTGEFLNAPTVAADRDGKWKAGFGKQEAGTGWSITIKGANNTVTLKNVAVGEVWVCSGQSNMEWSVNASETPAEVKAAASHPTLRLFTVQKRTAPQPITDPNDLKHFTKWVECSPETVGGFSAVAYHFGVKLQKELNVPVGLIHTSWGGTPAEAWTSLEALEADPALKHYAANHTKMVKQFEQAKASYTPEKAKEQYAAAMKKWEAAAAKAKEEGKPEPKKPALQQRPTALGPNTPGVLYNAMIHPLLPFAVKGAIWYQGESNASRAYEYRTLFTTMITGWRKRFATELPFMLVQLAPFMAIDNEPTESQWAELREAQLMATQKLPKVGMAVITDVGDEKDIHPRPKRPVGERLAVAALGIGYGKKNEPIGPVYKAMTVEGDKAVLSFDHVGGGLEAKGGKLTGFTVAGEDRTFYNADAEIKGDTVVVHSDKVAKPVAVRFGWANYPVVNLWSKDGLPATPFRTDTFPGVTEPKKAGTDPQKKS